MEKDFSIFTMISIQDDTSEKIMAQGRLTGYMILAFIEHLPDDMPESLLAEIAVAIFNKLK